jgi:hypothetical protein
MNAIDVVRHLARLHADRQIPSIAEYFDSNAELHPFALPGRVYRGPEGFLQAVSDASDPELPESTVLSMLDAGNKVVVLGEMALPRRRETGSLYTLRQSVAWVVTVRNGKVTCTESFADWTEARRAAGLSSD